MMHQKTVFDNGLRLVSEYIPHARTVSFGIWVDVGARDEHDLTNGCSHFVEHMLFKGTARRSAAQIARELDVLGGTANAFTSKDATCFYATVLDNRLPQLLELFTDFFFHSLFAPQEVDRERQVILQEISMVEDTPEEMVYELFEGMLWGHHPLGKTVLGSAEVVSHMDCKKLLDHVSRFYTADRIVLAAAGNVEHRQFVDLLNNAFSSLPAVPDSGTLRQKPQELNPVQKVFAKPLEQVHVTLGTYGLPVTSGDRYKLMLLNVLLGGNMSSRLFQEVREKRGLAYSVHSYLDSFADSGYLGIYLGVNPANLNESLSVVRTEIETLCRVPVYPSELDGARDYGRSGLFLAAENLESRMVRAARNELYFGRHISFDEVLDGLERVTADEVNELAVRLFGRGLTAAVLGPVVDADVAWDLPA